MKTIISMCIICLCTMSLFASELGVLTSGTSIVPNDKDYYRYKLENVQIIYTKDNVPFARHTANVEAPLHKNYEKFFDWKLDETLYVALVSDFNQIANGFSTQIPSNRQINYVGGAQMVDYFTSVSWLDTLIYHETSHNYQLNVKKSSVSQALHYVFGNGTLFFPFPFSVPNTMENSFMLEGNAVLNESWHGNGGRLYSGRLKAQTLLQAKAGKIVAGEVYNSKLEFPYGEIVYIQGGFYNLYLAQKYGIEKVNSYFKYHSQDWWWPLFTNASMRKAVGINFETSLDEYAKEYAQMAKNMVVADGEHLVSSQFFSSLSNNSKEIFFLTNETGNRAPELVVINKEDLSISKTRDSWIRGKVIKVDGEYYVQGSKNISPVKISQGLFDDAAFIKKGTESKIVHGYLSDAREVYFDVPSSFSQPQLYVGTEFYGQVNSSVIIDKEDNLYYFKQKDKTRTLYKNKTPLFSYEGFYGIVSDVDSEGRVYFVANSELGSTLYSYKDAKVSRSSLADNIVEARLVNDKEILLAAISDKDYYYVKNEIQHVNQTPYETKLFFEDKEYYGKREEQTDKYTSIQNLSDPYLSFLNMDYSGTDFSVGYGVNGLLGNLNVVFGDPLSQNSAAAFINRTEAGTTIAGVSYSNSQYLLEYGMSVYALVEKASRTNTRESGIILGASLPLYKAGYYFARLSANYYQDYDMTQREPLSVTLLARTSENYGISMYSNYLNELKLYEVLDRDDRISGGKYSYAHDLSNEFYIGFGAKYSQTDEHGNDNIGGVKITNFAFQLDADPSTITMPNLTKTFYAKHAGYGEASLSKVFNFSSYFFTFPVSLQRESIYSKYRHYKVSDFFDNMASINEVTVGLVLSTVFLNSFALPITFEYIHNDTDTNLVKNENLFRFLVGGSF